MKNETRLTLEMECATAHIWGDEKLATAIIVYKERTPNEPKPEIEADERTA